MIRSRAHFTTQNCPEFVITRLLLVRYYYIIRNTFQLLEPHTCALILSLSQKPKTYALINFGWWLNWKSVVVSSSTPTSIHTFSSRLCLTSFQLAILYGKGWPAFQ